MNLRQYRMNFWSAISIMLITSYLINDTFFKHLLFISKVSFNLNFQLWMLLSVALALLATLFPPAS
jgi:uncharacterized membrane protein YhaH (DUF805 family)